MTLNLQEVARAMRAAGRAPDIPVAGWSVDTRTQNSGDVYFALRGPNHDGHAFLAAAAEKGASVVVVDRPANVGQALSPANPPEELVVSDTLRALQELVAWARRRWGQTVIGVTGSAGKTTTKDAIAHLLEAEFLVGRTLGNFNNHLGVPISI